MPSPQKENAPPMPERPPFSGWHLALRPVCSAVLETRGSETQLRLFHAVDVWRTTEGGDKLAEERTCQYVVEEKVAEWYIENIFLVPSYL